MLRSLVGSEMCIRDRSTQSTGVEQRCPMSKTWYTDQYDESDGDDDLPPARAGLSSGRAGDDSPKGAAARATRRSHSPRSPAPQLPQAPRAEIVHAAKGAPENSAFLHSLRKTGSGQLEDIMTTVQLLKMKLEKAEQEKLLLVEEADQATKRAADLEVALAEERRRRKEEKAIRIEAEEEMKRAQDERDKLEFELSVIVDELSLIHI
eukprot:TRINITY_DN845_c0_g1_i5.p1 TRINITY_DN845_c0_g1~~TRINITY_DN845_c0_g1_i5.p1  ORF type:complete len:207 (-),score=51.53 TRINITY_DN845_c0_g1_i5:144-764(-)